MRQDRRINGMFLQMKKKNKVDVQMLKRYLFHSSIHRFSIHVLIDQWISDQIIDSSSIWR